MSHRYFTADVFTSTRFGGNPLAVLPEARGLTDAEMLAITREFNYSESTFVFPPDDPAHTRRVRIFTPGGEVPFAGHPTVGTAFVLATIGEIALAGDETRIVLEEKVGPVPVLIRARNGTPVFSQLSVAMLPEVGPPLPPRADLAAALSLFEDDLLQGVLFPQVVSCGLPFAFVPVRDRGAVEQARMRLDRWEACLAGTAGAMVMVFAMDAAEPGHDVRARMFAPAFRSPRIPPPAPPAPHSAATGDARPARRDPALGGRTGLRDGRPACSRSKRTATATPSRPCAWAGERDGVRGRIEI